LLGELAQRRGEPEKAIRAVKGLYPAYFSLPVEDAPFQFWQLAYPLPWRSQVESLAKENSLDPFLIAGLIRQESEFDAEAISRSNARGLTQVMPTTGLDLSRRVGLKGFHTGLLHSPDVNLKLGTFYMRWLLNLTEERPEFMLASYNAGKSRVDNWRNIYRFREPAEFIESIPLAETRNYVQVVLRNADFYRRLYANRPDTFTPTPAAKPIPAPAPVVRKATPKKGQVSSKNAQSGRKVVRPTRGAR
jgi:soluble lytic murein transglycosylase